MTLTNSLGNRKLLHINSYIYSGGGTFTAHLCHMLDEKIVLKPSNTLESQIRDFGYGIKYQNTPLDAIGVVAKRMFITAFQKEYYHMLPFFKDKDVMIVVHDPTDANGWAEYLDGWKLLVIRETMKDYLKENNNLDSVYVPHPFYPYPLPQEAKHDKLIVSMSRLQFNKKTEILIGANKLLPENKRIDIYGAYNRIYEFHTLKIKLKEYPYYKGMYPKTFKAISDILAQYKYMIDLSTFKGDGGGTQYTFLQAIYSDVAIILHRGWLDFKNSPFVEGYNCLAVESVEELVDLLNSNPDVEKIKTNARKLLDVHTNVGPKWNEQITK